MNISRNIHIGAWQQVAPQDVIMMKAFVNYTVLYFANGKHLMVATPLKQLESRFSHCNFFRTHKSYLINMACVKHFVEADNKVQLTGNQSVEVSRRKLSEFKSKLYFG